MSEGNNASALTAAIQWLEQILYGYGATALATIAVAGFGFALLTGRMDLRRGFQVVLGCFILFGASSIANGLVSAARGEQRDVPDAVAQEPPPVLVQTPPVSQPAQTTGSDPYAGAALLPH